MGKSKQLKTLACAAAAVLTMNGAAKAALYIYEPFDYTAGQAISGQQNTTSALPETWLDAGTIGSTVHQVGASGLSGGVQPNAGNDGDVKQSDVTELERMNIPYAIGAAGNSGPTFAANSTLYYSLLVNIPSAGLSTLTVANSNATANNDMLVAFNNAQGSQATRPNSWNGELVIKKGATAGTFDLGVHGSSPNNAAGFTGDLSPDTTYFVVVEAQINSTDTVGTNSIWLNPDSSTWGADESTRPAADHTNTGLGNVSGTWSMQSLLIGAGITAGAAPADTLLDDIRVGDTWADVTTNNASLAVPEPAGLSLLAFGALGLWRRRRV